MSSSADSLLALSASQLPGHRHPNPVSFTLDLTCTQPPPCQSVSKASTTPTSSITWWLGFVITRPRDPPHLSLAPSSTHTHISLLQTLWHLSFSYKLLPQHLIDWDRICLSMPGCKRSTNNQSVPHFTGLNSAPSTNHLQSQQALLQSTHKFRPQRSAHAGSRLST